MGKVPVRLREVVYTLSPFEQNVMGGLFKDFSHKFMHNIKDKLVPATLYGLLPTVGVVWLCNSIEEKDKMSHRY